MISEWHHLIDFSFQWIFCWYNNAITCDCQIFDYFIVFVKQFGDKVRIIIDGHLLIYFDVPYIITDSYIKIVACNAQQKSSIRQICIKMGFSKASLRIRPALILSIKTNALHFLMSCTSIQSHAHFRPFSYGCFPSQVFLCPSVSWIY